MDGAMGAMGSSTSLPLSTLSSPYCPEHTLPILETLQEDSPRVEDKGMLPMNMLYSSLYSQFALLEKRKNATLSLYVTLV
jgi:hypothetical protein